MVSGASPRTFSSRVSRAAGSMPAGSSCSVSTPGARASSSTRSPPAARSPALSMIWRCSDAAPRIISGAPRTQVPFPSKLSELHLRAEEKGTEAVRRQAPPGGGGKAAAMASRVSLRTGVSDPSAPRAAARSSCPSSASMRPKTSDPSVRVPVLSTQTMSTRASPSTAGSSCTSTLRPARVMAATAKATLVRRTSPSGTMPTSPATTPGMASLRLSTVRSLRVPAALSWL